MRLTAAVQRGERGGTGRRGGPSPRARAGVCACASQRGRPRATTTLDAAFLSHERGRRWGSGVARRSLGEGEEEGTAGELVEDEQGQHPGAFVDASEAPAADFTSPVEEREERVNGDDYDEDDYLSDSEREPGKEHGREGEREKMTTKSSLAFPSRPSLAPRRMTDTEFSPTPAIVARFASPFTPLSLGSALTSIVRRQCTWWAWSSRARR